MTIPLIVLIPFLGAALVAWAGHHGRLRSAFAAAGTTFSALLLLIPSIGEVMQGATLLWQFDWLAAAGLTLSFRLDGLGLTQPTPIQEQAIPQAAPTPHPAWETRVVGYPHQVSTCQVIEGSLEEKADKILQLFNDKGWLQ